MRLVDSMGFKLTIRDIDGGAHDRVFNDQQVTMGSRPENTLLLKHGEVSRQHALIEQRGEEVVLLDRGSLNGTQLNGSDIDPRAPVPLRSGDRIELGPFQLTFFALDESSSDNTIFKPGNTDRVLEPARRIDAPSVCGCVRSAR